MLLQAAEALADLARAHGADAGDRLEVALRRADDPFEPVPIVPAEGTPVLDLDALDVSFRNAIRGHDLDVIMRHY